MLIEFNGFSELLLSRFSKKEHLRIFFISLFQSCNNRFWGYFFLNVDGDSGDPKLLASFLLAAPYQLRVQRRIVRILFLDWMLVLYRKFCRLFLGRNALALILSVFIGSYRRCFGGG